MAAADKSEEQIGPAREALKVISGAVHPSARGKRRAWNGRCVTGGARSRRWSRSKDKCDVCNSELPPARKWPRSGRTTRRSLADAQARQKEVKAEGARLKADITKTRKRTARVLEADARTAREDRTRLGQVDQHLMERGGDPGHAPEPANCRGRGSHQDV